MYALLVLAILAPADTAASERGTLNGLVQDETGRPLKDATVLISTAAPRIGVGIL
jgi:hypothetical protein